MTLNVEEDALVGGGLAAHVVLSLQAIHRNHELQVRQRGPRQWDRTERTGHNLDVGALDQLRQQDLEFPVTDERVASNNRHMERAMSIHHFEHACDQFLSLEIRQAAQVRGPEMSVLVRVAPRTTQRAFLCDFNGKRRDSTPQGAAPSLQNWLDPQCTHCFPC